VQNGLNSTKASQQAATKQTPAKSYTTSTNRTNRKTRKITIQRRRKPTQKAKTMQQKTKPGTTTTRKEKFTIIK
jgi:hypothetical protein